MFSRKDIEHLAKLARMRLQEGEIERYSKELDSILAYVSKLQEVKDKPRERKPGEGHWAELREDEPAKPFVDDPGSRAGKLIEAMPKTQKGLLVVPKVIEKGVGSRE